jgi:LacI family transcriptional regulator
MQTLKKHGINLPNDMAFAGFNNDPLTCVIEPNLTTINYKGYEMGEVAAKQMISRLMNKDEIQPAHSLILKYELIVRESSLRNQNSLNYTLNEPQS